MKIAVAGGTGIVGRHVEAALKARGHEPVTLSRSAGVDLLSASGLEEAVQGVAAVVDVTSTTSQSAKAAVRFFGTVTRNLLAAEKRAGVPHHVALSIVGAAKADSGYYAGKAAQERILLAMPGGWSMVRATQFHEFAQQMTTRAAFGPLQLAPVARCQPIAAAEVGEALAEIALGEPRGLDRDLAGPREEQLTHMIRAYLAARGMRRVVIDFGMPGAMGRGMRDGGILPGPDARLGTQTFDEWLAQQTS
ncbi:SDR family oxidoreductase [Rathayibacter sp. KR2-224]|uniref:SDR family oxidoreductase n=1 Tax=Rathayibacter sp. KR2-224 TaxID=3400913 RepID=UPI003C01C22E